MRGATRQLDRVADEATWPASVPSLPAGVEADLVKGLYRLGEHKARAPRASVRLVGSGTILREAIAAAELLASEWMMEAFGPHRASMSGNACTSSRIRPARWLKSRRARSRCPVPYIQLLTV